MTIKEAILKVMRDKGEPISTSDAYQLIIDNKLYEFGAKEPKSVVRNEIRRQCLGIDWKSSRSGKVFKLCEGGLYEPIENFQQIDPVNISVGEEVLEEPIRDQIRSLSLEHKEQFIEEVVESLNSLTPEEFEKFSRDLLAAYGLQKVEVTNRGSDGGIDGFAKLPAGITTLNVSFQCKRWQANVGSPEIDRFRGAMDGKNIHQGIFLTTSYYSSSAKEVAQREHAQPVILLDGRQIVMLMIEKGFKVQATPFYEYRLEL